MSLILLQQGATPSLLTTATMASTTDKIIAGLRYSNLPKVTGEPTFEDLKITHRLLNSKAMSVFSYEGGR
jgi:hypothetical protein